ncbi:MAG TPA: EF-P beta-lysylation protein EpmB [Planctomycetaceae bacterium]|nr:EF-P beta-lysylation protein EpmB [Planctomycetaceae bacterium]
MLSPLIPPVARAAWQQSLVNAVRDPAVLLERLSLPRNLLPAAQRAAKLFPLRVPESYVARMTIGDLHDPLLRQVLPLNSEEDVVVGFEVDAVGDDAAQRAPGLLKKYDGRALLITTGVCAVHCRYCFRRHYPYAESPQQLDDWQPALQALAADDSIHEVLLSGGDPLALTDSRLFALIGELEQIPHLRRLRIHTRFPIVLPERITADLLERLRESRLRTWMVIHANHAQELTGDCADAIERIVRSGISTLNQAVLLRGVNDSVTALHDLCERLVDLGVMPYYLHQLDRVTGTAHFEVAETTGRAMIAELRRRLPGYAVPQYVREIPGEAHKTPLM